MRRRCRIDLLMLALAVAIAGGGAHAQRSENAAAAQIHSAVASGGAGESASASIAGTLGQTLTDRAENAAATLHGGLHAPPVDRLGLLTRQRIVDFLLGRPLELDLMAVDAAGNHDGRVDVGDLIAWVLRGRF